MIKQACVDIPDGKSCEGCLFCNYHVTSVIFECILFKKELDPNSTLKCKECLDKYGE